MKIVQKLINPFQKTKYLSPKITSSNFSDLKLGKKINSGVESSVYNLKGFKDLVVKTNNFIPELLEWDINPFTHSVLSTKDKHTVIMKKVKGKPLFNLNWTMSATPSIFSYKKQLMQLLKISDSAYENYIDDLLNLRENSYNMDTINPNNILYDKKNKKFNLVDIKKDEKVIKSISLQDFYPFWDEIRLYNIYDKANYIEKIQIANLVKKLMVKILKIVNNKGFDIKVESLDKYHTQKASTYFYHGERKKIDKLLKWESFRRLYLLRTDD